MAGAQKLMIQHNVTYLEGAPYGALVASFSKKINPTTISDFPFGLRTCQNSRTVVAPTDGGYLFLAVNDTNLTDNSGSFVVDIARERSLLKLGVVASQARIQSHPSTTSLLA